MFVGKRNEFVVGEIESAQFTQSVAWQLSEGIVREVEVVEQTQIGEEFGRKTPDDVRRSIDVAQVRQSGNSVDQMETIMRQVEIRQGAQLTEMRRKLL